MPRHDAVALNCPAKINLALSVGSPDQSGLHPIASWMVAVRFGDRLSIEAWDAAQSRFDIRFQPDAPAGGTVTWPLGDDLAYRAHALLERRMGRPLPARVRLDKRIPVGSGLGGGSSNAAATLVALDRQFDLGLDRDELVHLGQQLGSDVGFAVYAILGHPSVIVSGRGDRLEPVDQTDPVHLVLVLPPLACPTPEVYRQFDAMKTAARSQPQVREALPDLEAVRALVGQDLRSGLFNDLADAACAVQPRLRDYREQLHQALDLPAHITGSGAAMFVVTSSPEEAEAAASKATAATGLPAVATRTLERFHP